MCTVTFLPVAGKYLVTSNRDESSLRKKAIPPAVYNVVQSKLLYPKDANAGGTWIAVNENGNIIVLLNGAFTKHKHTPPYKKSRGIILLEIISDISPLIAFDLIDLHQVEPFTIVLFCAGELYECRWDGHQKYKKQLDTNKPYMWSSSTLYEPAIVKKRESWLAGWLKKNTSPSLYDVMHFHASAGDGDTHNDLNMNRNGHMLTVSITGIELSASKAVMLYNDLNSKTEYKQSLTLKQALTTSA